MQTSVKPIQLRGHNFESEVTVRHRTTLGRYEASVAGYPNLVGEGVTEALALDDLATMLSSDPKAYAEVEAKIKETQDQNETDAAKAKTDNETVKEKGDPRKDIPPAPGSGTRPATGASPGAGTPTGAGMVPTGAGTAPSGSPTGEAKDTLAPTQGATITKA